MNKVYKIVLAACVGMVLSGCGSSGSSGNEPQLETQDGQFVSQFCQQNPQNQSCQQEAFCQTNPTATSCQPSTQCIDPQAQSCAGLLNNAVQNGYSPDYSYHQPSNTHCCPAGGVPTYVDGAYVCATTYGQKRSTTGGYIRIKFKENRKGKIKSNVEAELYAAEQNDSVTNYTNIAGNHCYESVQVAPYSNPTTYGGSTPYQQPTYNQPTYNQPNYNQGNGYQGNGYQQQNTGY